MKRVAQIVWSRSSALRQTFASILGTMICLITFGASAQSWNYEISATGEPGAIYRQAGDPLGSGYVTLEEKNGVAILKMTGIKLIKCYQGELEATVEKTAETTTITVPPKMSGCSWIRLVIKNDGTGGKREIKSGDSWVWDKFERGLTARK